MSLLVKKFDYKELKKESKEGKRLYASYNVKKFY